MDQHDFSSDEELAPKYESILKQTLLFKIQTNCGLKIEEYVNKSSQMFILQSRVGKSNFRQQAQTSQCQRQLSTANYHKQPAGDGVGGITMSPTNNQREKMWYGLYPIIRNLYLNKSSRTHSIL